MPILSIPHCCRRMDGSGFSSFGFHFRLVFAENGISCSVLQESASFPFPVRPDLPGRSSLPVSPPAYHFLGPVSIKYRRPPHPPPPLCITLPARTSYINLRLPLPPQNSTTPLHPPPPSLVCIAPPHAQLIRVSPPPIN